MKTVVLLMLPPGGQAVSVSQSGGEWKGRVLASPTAATHPGSALRIVGLAIGAAWFPLAMHAHGDSGRLVAPS